MRLNLGTKIYYTGDMANSSGHFVVTGMGRVSTLGYPSGRASVTLAEIGGNRIFRGIFLCQIGEVYQGTCDPRFVTEEAYQAYRTAMFAAARR